MRICKISIHNYRSIRDLEMECGPLVVLLGPNNHGKSNIISAIDFALSTSAKPTKEDFFAYKEGEEEIRANDLWVELTFDQLTEQEKVTNKRHLLSGETTTFCIRKTAKQAKDSVEVLPTQSYVEEPKESWLKKSNADELQKRETAEATPLKDYVPRTGKLPKKSIEEAQDKYIQEHQGELTYELALEAYLGAKNVSGVLPDFTIVPAVRDLSDETKVKTTTVFGKLLDRAVKETLELDPKYQKIKENINELTKTLEFTGLEKDLEIELANQWEEEVKVGIEVTPPSMQKIFELGTDLLLDDGMVTSASQKGHGLQRAVLFALIRAWAKALSKSKAGEGKELAPRKSSESVFFAIEEPELFLHPHAQRRLTKAIQDIAETPQHQVFICTHSTHFVDLNKYKSICIVRKDSTKTGSSLRQCKEELFEGEGYGDRKWRFRMAQWINPDRGELFFARKTVFVEGETEKVIFPYLADKLGCFDSTVSLIDCGSKNNLPMYIKIANAFNLRYVVIHDEDTDDRSKNEEIARLVKPELGRIEIFSPKFEVEAGIPEPTDKKAKRKPFEALKFFEGKSAEQIPEKIVRVLKNIYQDECEFVD